MADKTAIQWAALTNEEGQLLAGATLNVAGGCTKVNSACTNCLGPETPILYADMVWRPIGDAKVGDELLGFDESTTGQWGRRKMRRSVVEAVWRSKQTTMRLRTEHSEINTTADHRWLTKNKCHWMYTKDAHVGTPLRYIPVTDNLPFTDDYRLGYISGMTAGDGTYKYEMGQRSDKMGFPQAYWRVALSDIEPLLRLVQYGRVFGIDLHIMPFAGGGIKGMQKVETRSLGNLEIMDNILRHRNETPEFARGWMAGFFDAEGSASDEQLRVCHVRGRNEYLNTFFKYADMFDIPMVKESYKGPSDYLRLAARLRERIRFFSITRPALMRKMEGIFDKVPYTIASRVLSRELTGKESEVVDIQTSTGTFFADGLMTHNCYAMAVTANLAQKFRDTPMGEKYGRLTVIKGGRSEWSNCIELFPERLEKWARKKKPTGTFVSSLTDVFHEDIPDSYIHEVFGMFAVTPWHRYYVLTKRPERMAEVLLAGQAQILAEAKRWCERLGKGYVVPDQWPLPNVWCGTSPGAQDTLKPFMEALAQVPAVVRWLSVEPMIDEMYIADTLLSADLPDDLRARLDAFLASGNQGLNPVFQWCVLGGESGPRSRRMDLSWVRRAIGDCKGLGISVFMKQKGTILAGEMHCKDHKGGVMEEWPEDIQVRGFPAPKDMMF